MFRAFVRNSLMPDTQFYRRFLDAQSRPFLNDCFLFLWFFSGKIRHKTEITEHAQICKYVNLLGLQENRLLEAIKKNCKEKCARNISSLKKSAITDRSEADRAHFLHLHLPVLQTTMNRCF